MTTTEYQNELKEILAAYGKDVVRVATGSIEGGLHLSFDQAQASITALNARRDDISKVDRLEVIDDTGRAYVKGAIYGSPVSIELSYQDDGRTLKVFVEKRLTHHSTGPADDYHDRNSREGGDMPQVISGKVQIDNSTMVSYPSQMISTETASSNPSERAAGGEKS